ncbi:hypothetical protein [Mycolicibacterium sp. S3B2]|uniref:hypothetical protein n=1 Tax=Mycolicibacterium sp. S3B2 TaxID=3415120 RepID=UPI003C7DC400
MITRVTVTALAAASLMFAAPAAAENMSVVYQTEHGPVTTTWRHSGVVEPGNPFVQVQTTNPTIGTATMNPTGGWNAICPDGTRRASTARSTYEVGPHSETMGLLYFEGPGCVPVALDTKSGPEGIIGPGA